MKKLIHDDDSDLGRLHCDNTECGYVLPEPLPWSEALIGHSCPRCGDNMLTASDFKAVERMRSVVRGINKLFGWHGTKRQRSTILARRFASRTASSCPRMANYRTRRCGF